MSDHEILLLNTFYICDQQNSASKCIVYATMFIPPKIHEILFSLDCMRFGHVNASHVQCKCNVNVNVMMSCLCHVNAK